MINKKHISLNNITQSKIQSHKIYDWFKNKGWRLYDYQLKTYNAVKNKRDVLVISPTGSGKTIAAFLPTMVESDFFKKNVLYTLYISPLKSLGYDVKRNILRPIKELNLDVSISVRTEIQTLIQKHIKKSHLTFLLQLRSLLLY